MKIWINGTPCTGKTYFIKAHKAKYRSFDLVDCDDYKPLEQDCSKILETLQDNTVFFSGGFCKPFCKEVAFLTVIIPLQDLERNVQLRKQLYGDWAGSFSHLNSLIHSPEFGRNSLINLSKKFDVPIFDSIEKAIDSVFVLNY